MSVQYSEFVGKVVVVTGAASGIGFAQAEAFFAQGALVVGIDIQSEGLQELAKNNNFTHYIGDVTDENFLAETVRKIYHQFKKIDILLNTAGILDDYLPSLETPEELWDKIMSTNLKSMFRLTNLILPQMLASGKGTIINMASIAGLVAGGGGAAYTASKHAIVGYTKQLALDYADKGIHINAIAPGAIRTPMNKADFAGTGEMAKWVADQTPVKRWADPEEVANLTLFLASQQSQYMQGDVIPIDGGWLLK